MLVVCTMTIQPVLESLVCIDKQDIEYVDINIEKDSNETDNQQEDSKDEKVEFQNPPFGHIAFYYVSLKNSQSLVLSLKDLIKDIPIPPPDVA